LLFGAGLVGLRSLATGLPVGVLLDPRKALADVPACPTQPQFILLNTSRDGDPIGCNVPGTYEDANIVHPQDASMVATRLTLRGQPYMAAAPWAKLPQATLDRTCFAHIMTNTPIHPKEPNVLRLMGATGSSGEMFPSVLAKLLAPCLKTIQTQPISVGASNPSETITFNGAALPTMPPSALKATLLNAPGALTNLQKLRDDTLNAMCGPTGAYRTMASPAQKQYLDSMILSQQQVRGIRQDLLANLNDIGDDSITSQMIAAVTLILMGVTPVVAVHIPFGGDNHGDKALAKETTETVSGVDAINGLMTLLAQNNLQDKVSFLSLNVFGRTMGKGNDNGRSHNPNHQVSIMIGKPFKGCVLGGVTPVTPDYGALPINSKTGAGDLNGDIPASATLASFAKTVLTGLGVDAATVNAQITSGTVIGPALA
jgi:hypothetical protein